MKKISNIILTLALLLGIFGLAKSSWAATITAASCEQDKVQEAINLAKDGDTIVIPAGTCSWTGGLTWDKGVTIQGAGPTSTILSAAQGMDFFKIPWTVSGGNYRLTGLGLTGSGQIAVDGNFNSARFDHLNINTTVTQTFWINYQAVGAEVTYGYPQNYKVLFDHITFTPPTGCHIFAELYGKNTAWMEDDDLGSENYVFIEDSTFNYPDATCEVIDSEGGARYTFRYNTVINSLGTCAHDLGSSPERRGTRMMEVYNNSFTCTQSSCFTAANFNRGGSGLFYNNVLTGTYTNVSWPEIWRLSFDSWVGGGYCSQTGSRKMCEDGISHCVGGSNPGVPCDPWNGQCQGGGLCPYVNGNYTDYSCTSDAGCLKPDGSVGKCIQIDGPGATNAPGYPCRDQMGRGKDNSDGTQSSQPAYWWNNTLNGSPVNLSVSTYPDYIQEGRDYCNHSPVDTCGAKPAWSYTPYTYPHPLQGGAPSSVLYGDVDNSHSVSAYDAALVAQAAVGLIIFTSDQIKAGDVDGNGSITAYDAALIAQKAVGLISKFPVE